MASQPIPAGTSCKSFVLNSTTALPQASSFYISTTGTANFTMANGVSTTGAISWAVGYYPIAVSSVVSPATTGASGVAFY